MQRKILWQIKILWQRKILWQTIKNPLANEVTRGFYVRGDDSVVGVPHITLRLV